MNSMVSKGKDKEIKKLSEILSIIQNLYYKKKEQLEELQLEISKLKEVLNALNLIVSNKSFYSADEIYQNVLNKFDKDKESIEEYFKTEITEEKAKGTKIKRKIFSKDEEDLLCVLNFIDFNRVEIKFIDPQLRAIKETSESFISIFLRGALLQIKNKNPDLNLSYKYFKNTDIIEIIKISNLKSINEYDLITSRIRNILLESY